MGLQCEVQTHQLMQRPNRNITKAYRSRREEMLLVGSPFSSSPDRGRDSSTLIWAVRMRPELGHRLDIKSPAAQSNRDPYVYKLH